MSNQDEFFKKATRVEDAEKAESAKIARIENNRKARIARGNATCPHCKAEMETTGAAAAAWHGCSYNLMGLALCMTCVLSPFGIVLLYLGRKSLKEVYWKCPACQYGFKKV